MVYDDKMQLNEKEEARWRRLIKLYQNLNKELERLGKEEKTLRVKVLKALDQEKMEKVHQFIRKQNQDN
ncbi:MAG: hypothetical protein AAB678_02450 [Patescibacteria group bacterium]